jgi:hypothetical protein
VNYYTCNRFMRNKSVNADLYDQYMRTHCVDAVHYCADDELPSDERSSPCSVAPRPAGTQQRAAVRTASPVTIRLAASAESRTPSSDHFEGMHRQSLVEVTPEMMQRYGPTDKQAASPQKQPKQPTHPKQPVDANEFDANEYALFSPSDAKETEKTRLFGAQQY